MKKTLTFIFILCLIASLLYGCRVEDDANYYGAGAGFESDDISSGDEMSVENSEPFTCEIAIEHLFKAKMAAGGYAHTVALCEDGTVWGWGNDFYGCINSSKPEQIKGLSDIVYVAAGNNTSAAIKSDGTLWMWGAGWTTDGAMHSYSLTLDQPYLNDVVDVSIGCYFTAALKSDGSVWIWGVDYNENMEVQKVPKKIEGLPKIKKIATNWYNIAFLDEEGFVWYFETEHKIPDKPKIINGLSEVNSITGGGRHFVALKSDGTVCTFADYIITSQINVLSDIVDIAAGAFNTVAVKKDGTVWSWGQHKQSLGDGIHFENKTPVQVILPTKATGVSSGDSHVIITTSDDFWAWGDNRMGQLGYGVQSKDQYDITTNRNIPVKVVCFNEKDAKQGNDESSKPINETSECDSPLLHTLHPDGFVATDLNVIRKNINLDHSDLVKYYDPDPSEFLPMYPPFLKMDKDTLFSIFETIKKYDWEPYGESINALTTRACVITLVCDNTVMTYLQFAKDEQGRCYVYSMYDKRIAYLSEKDFNEIREKFETAPEWPEKYFERYGMRHFSEYDPDKLYD